MMDNISKEAVVCQVETGCVIVSVTSCSACHQCHAKSFCGLSEKEEKLIKIETPKAAEYRKGEEVIISLKSTKGYYAVFFGYLLPLLLLVGVICAVSLSGYDDFISGISGIIVLIPYYFGVFLLNKKLKNIFSFTLSHKN